MGVEPGLSDVFARYAADHLFSEIDEIGVRDGADLVVDGYDFAPTFSIWTTIEECLNPPLVWERDRGFFTLPPFSEPETFVFPEGIGPIECVHVEHEEVVLIPRVVDCRRVTFKYGLGDEFIEVLRTLHKTGLASTTPVRVRGVEVSPRDLVAAVLPDPADARRSHARPHVRGDVGDRHRRRRHARARCTCTTSPTTRRRWRGTARRPSCGRPRSIRSSRWSCWRRACGRARACSAPRRSTPVPFLDRLRDRGEAWHVDERTPQP